MSRVPPAVPALAPPVAPLRVLVVDDQPAVRQGLLRLLRGSADAPREVRAAAGLADAREALATWGPHVVLLDVDLAGDDGLSLLPGAAGSAHVLVLTSHGDVATRARAARLGAQAFIEKSAPAAELLSHLDRLCATHAVSHFGWEESPPHPGPSGPPPTV